MPAAMPMQDEALGLLETRGLVAAVEACDAMLKAASVRLLRQQVVSPALVTICVIGETAAVQAALDAGARSAARVGPVLSTHLIPRPAAGLLELAGALASAAWSPRPSPPAGPAQPPAAPRPGRPRKSAPGAVPRPPVPTAKGAAVRPVSRAELQALPVRALRALARSLEGFPLQGRRISLAGREELLARLAAFLFDDR
jgi:ethanolamine utilization protein EutM